MGTKSMAFSLRWSCVACPPQMPYIYMHVARSGAWSGFTTDSRAQMIRKEQHEQIIVEFKMQQVRQRVDGRLASRLVPSCSFNTDEVKIDLMTIASFACACSTH